MIESYRDGFMSADMRGCEALDDLWAQQGERWLSSTEAVNIDEHRTAQDIYDLMGPGFEPENVLKWAQRHPREVPRRGYWKGRPLFRVGDVCDFQKNVRQ